MTQSVSLLARAKINLGLRVLAREVSGFHQIETIFARVSLADSLTLTLGSPGIRLRVTGDVGGAAPDDNLVTRAVRAYHEAARVEPGVDVRLEKRIPVGAGLGGGSADAAATLLGLDQLLGQPLGLERMRTIAAGLGSDVPFLLEAMPMALAWGRGERMMSLRPPGPAWAVLALPDVHIETGWAYGALSETPDSDVGSGAPYPGASLDWHQIAARTGNQFERVVYGRHPELATLRERLEGESPLAARMTGTGAAHYALFESRDRAVEALSRLGADLPDLRLELAEIG